MKHGYKGPILDYIVITVPTEVDPEHPAFRRYLDRLAEHTTMGQYKKRRPKALVMDKTDWLITSDWEDVERAQPAHDCPTCRAGNDQAIAFLKEHPDKRLALGNLRYWEVW